MTIVLSDLQQRAVDQIVDWFGDKDPRRQVFYLAGYAGTGKSTITSQAIEALKAKYNIEKVAMAAYTGKAASVLRRKGNRGAKTIHSLCYKLKKETAFDLKWSLDVDGEASEVDIIVLDECSMVDQVMASDLCSFKKKVLVMGDPGQLPPVSGQGAFTNQEPNFSLTEIHRQAAESPILELATLARQGKPLPIGFDRGGVRVLPLTQETQPLIYRPETQVICGLNRVRWTYNRRIRAQRGFSGEEPMVGERIICCKNNRNIGLYNGALGTLEKFQSEYKKSSGAYKIDVQLDDHHETHTDLETDPVHFDNHFTGGQSKRFQYPKKRLEEFDWGYVLTCHKAQGSSWPDTTIVDDSASFRDNSARWLYTAITRAEIRLTVLIRQ